MSASFGLGAVLLQRHEEAMRPVPYASRAMTASEQRYYSQIEKEALAMTWSLERFSDYLYVMQFQTDHKPLVSLPKLKEKPR